MEDEDSVVVDVPVAVGVAHGGSAGQSSQLSIISTLLSVSKLTSFNNEISLSLSHCNKSDIEGRTSMSLTSQQAKFSCDRFPI